MRILQRYIAVSYLTAFVLSILVLTFVMSLGLLFHATSLIARGVSVLLIVRFILSSAPETFAITIPLAALISALLVFGRLSADSEVAAMQACGIRVLQVLSMPLLIGALLTALSLYVNDRIAPDSHFERRRMMRETGVTTALQLLDEGRWIQDFAGLALWVGRREGHNLYDLLIYERGQPGRHREIRAEKAEVITEGDDLVFHLQNVRIDDPLNRGGAGSGSADFYPYVIPDVTRARTYNRTENNFYFWELLTAMQTAHIDHPEMDAARRAEWVSTLRVELSKRVALSFATFCFVLLGAPLGIRAHRRESSIGIAFSLAIAMLFYLCLLLAQSLTRSPHLRPEWVMLLPVLLSLGLGVLLIKRAE